MLAATLSPSYGIYSGYEHFENVPVAHGSEEYLDSEKYEVKQRALDGPLLPLVRRLNEIRRAEPALQRFENLRLLDTHGEHVFAYAKGTEIAVAVNLDPHAPREDVVVVPPDLGLPEQFPVLDLLTGERYRWRIGRNYVGLAPGGRMCSRSAHERAQRLYRLRTTFGVRDDSDTVSESSQARCQTAGPARRADVRVVGD